MALPGWGTAAGYVTKWLDPFFDKRKRLDADIAKTERKLKAITGIVGNESVHAELIDKLARLRKERSTIKD